MSTDFNPPASIADVPGLKKLTPLVGVYVLLKGGEVIYVGQSKDTWHRLREHRRGKGWTCKKDFDCVMFAACDESQLNKLEADLIRELSPSLNVQRNKSSWQFLAIEMAENGASLDEICKAVGRSPEVVRNNMPRRLKPQFRKSRIWNHAAYFAKTPKKWTIAALAEVAAMRKDGATLSAIAAKHGVSTERARQVLMMCEV